MSAVTGAVRVALSVLGGGLLLGGLTACSDEGDLSILNNGPSDVAVDTGDEELVVDADGGTVLARSAAIARTARPGSGRTAGSR